MDLKNTLNLPDPEFTIPMKASLATREPEIQAKWEEMRIYHAIQDARKDAPKFVLHDGPPYTNGPIHLGTAMNKILKDFVVKSHTLMGYRSPYIPGFDNHGLPIEQAVMKEFAAKKETPDIITLRKACRAHAQKYIELQTEQFKRLGVFGLWEKPYATMNYKFEAEIIRVFGRLVERGFIQKGLRPTLWSPTSRTALADTEIVYKEDHVSKAIYVRFPLRRDPNQFLDTFRNCYAIIWTTTPWTIPANLAVAFHPELNYAVVKVGDEHYIVLDTLVEKLAGEFGWESYEVVETYQGINFDHMVFKHPIFDRDSLAVLATYITTEDGTGIVHTAPGHGRDDFETGKKYGLPVLCPVDERGVLTEEAGEFEGIGYKQCDTAVVERLRELGMLLKDYDYVHSYPYAERDEQPVIFRATEQWFLMIDENNLRQNMLTELDSVNFKPANGENRIRSMVANRPDWCVSRQRPWGVGIPIFYGAKSHKPVFDPVAIECVAKVVEEGGSDAWFALSPQEILPEGYAHPDTGETEFVKETDVLDVWFDSGSTNIAVLEGKIEEQWEECWPADVYLEGSDQHRGWFNSSLTIATAVKDGAPYKSIVTHGFVVDEQGRKQSKRLGNVVDPVKVCNEFGADILRLWVASVDWTNETPLYNELLKKIGEDYRSLRNTLRFLLSNLYDYQEPFKGELLPFDKWIIEQCDLLVDDVIDAYKNFEYRQAITAISNFCTQQLSRTYLDAIKDRMYCDGKDWDSRRSGQAACHYVLLVLVKLLAPILAHTAEETYAKIPAYEKLPSVHMEILTRPSEERLEEIEGNDLQVTYSHAINERADCFAAFEQWKATAEVKDSQDVIVTVSNRSDQIELLKRIAPDELANLWKFSAVELVEGEEGFSFRVSEYEKCERSRLRRPDVKLRGEHMLTERDAKALGITD